MSLTALSDEGCVLIASHLPLVERLLLVGAACRRWSSLREYHGLWRDACIFIEPETRRSGSVVKMKDLNDLVAPPTFSMRGIWRALNALVPARAVRRLSIHADHPACRLGILDAPSRHELDLEAIAEVESLAISGCSITPTFLSSLGQLRFLQWVTDLSVEDAIHVSLRDVCRSLLDKMPNLVSLRFAAHSLDVFAYQAADVEAVRIALVEARGGDTPLLESFVLASDTQVAQLQPIVSAWNHDTSSEGSEYSDTDSGDESGGECF